jgi:2-keto-3-deoxy-L-arabinonate dehydratase
MKAHNEFFGVYPMAYALFDAKGELDRKAMQRQITALIKHEVHGVGVLGLASEVNKLSTSERYKLMEWVAEDVAGTVPLTVTVAEASISSQIEFVKAAAHAGAKWAILQPPPEKGMSEVELIRFFGAVAEASPLTLGIQNAPEYLGIGLSNSGIKTLNRNHANVSVIKLETTAIAIGRLREEVGEGIDIFNGRGGIEIIDSIRAGAVGIIPGAEACDVLTSIYNSMIEDTDKGEAQAERLYEKVLPLLVFLMDSMDTFLTYGKQVLGARLGMGEVNPRPPYSAATCFGVEAARRYAEALGSL